MNRVLAHLALLIVAITYGGNYLVAKGLMPDLIGPSGFIVLRVVGGGAMFWVVRALMRLKGDWESIDRSDWGRLFLCGTTGVAVNQLLFFNGLSATSPVNASIIMTINPILVLGISAVLLRTAITARKLTGIAIGGVGAVVLLVFSANQPSLHASWQGDLMILINATSYGFYLVLVKPIMSKYKPLTVISWVFLFGSLWVIPIGWEQALAIDWSAFETVHWQGLAYVILATTFMVYLLNIYALGHVQPTVVSIYIYLQPLLATGFSWWLASSGGTDYTADLTWVTGVCALAIFAGVALVSRTSAA
ncbi:MAG: DMT family transporter [Bacteroidetes bacterium]|jgi:drug/metabolite transporter (DMT)-like permease|nr:DMT family transporter [Bacteroidota bacterium]